METEAALRLQLILHQRLVCLTVWNLPPHSPSFQTQSLRLLRRQAAILPAEQRAASETIPPHSKGLHLHLRPRL